MSTYSDRFDGAVVARVGNKLQELAQARGKDASAVFGDWMDWVLDLFSVERLATGANVVERIEAAKVEAPEFAEMFGLWADATGKAMERKGWGDLFGVLYEADLLTTRKASKTGQFFTPHDVCDLMAEITGLDKGDVAYDPACGSGRCLLSYEGMAVRKNYRRARMYVGGDVDPLCVKMTALNMMIHGMVGAAERRNALSQEFTEGWVVNEILSPKRGCIDFSIRHLTDERQYLAAVDLLKQQAREWNESNDRCEAMMNAMRSLLGMEATPSGAALPAEEAEAAVATEADEQPMEPQGNQARQLPLVFD